MSEVMMEEKKIGTGAKVGYFFLAIVPPIVCLVMQILCMMVLLFGKMIMAIAGGSIDPSSPGYMDAVMELTQSVAIPSVLFYHIVGTLLFGLWYYLCMNKPRKNAVKQAFKNVTAKSVLVAVGFGVLLCFLSNGTLPIDQALMPATYEKYVQLMEAAGMGVEPMAIIASCILAPIGEEFICRGLTLRFAQKAFGKFWIANIMQAFLFGVIHGNLIQGMYAFVIGLFLGWITKNYKSIIPAMLLHFTVNFSSTTWVGLVLEKLFGEDIPGFGVGIAMVLVPLVIMLPIVIKEGKKAV
ncbi:MAG: CPBP family intramembrane metalloprotease [Acetatifactor sp.]|nr:CPBP family intramembrane metalloprotease [Acetatifactor sp.]